jgi:DNA-binding NarL/FixJ family response regulator
VKNARILIVDDHEVVREGIKSLFADERPAWEICGEAANAEDAIEKAKTNKPNVIVLDISMPGMSGLEAAPKLRELCPDCPILIFTTHESPRLGEDVRVAGAQGFVLKTQAFRDLVRAIETLLGGGAFFGKNMAAEGADESPKPGSGQTLRARTKLAWRFHFPYLPA